MSLYRFYFLDRHDHIRSRADVECADDDDALGQATTVICDHPGIEVWQGNRVVGKLNQV